jgi:hypothetical protein
MSLLYKPLNAITEPDLDTLITDEEPELRAIEYKSRLHDTSTAEAKLEFLKDVSSFANAFGGDIVYGMTENKGIPTGKCGLPGVNLDQEMSRLGQVMRSHIRPRLRYDLQPVPLVDQSKGNVLILRIYNSFSRPHQIAVGEDRRFYSRASNGTYTLDVEELRTMFNLSNTLTKEIKAFRAARLDSIVAGETPVPLASRPKTVLHIIPLSAFDPASQLDLSRMRTDQGQLRPPASRAYSERYNIDGFLRYTPEGDGSTKEGYIQLYRNGIIEAVDTRWLRGTIQDGRSYIPSLAFEGYFITLLPDYLAVLNTVGAQPPLLLMLSILGVKGFHLAVRQGFGDTISEDKIDRDNIIMSEVLLDDFEAPAEVVLRPIFDALWNAAGYPSCMDYDEEGHWTGGR